MLSASKKTKLLGPRDYRIVPWKNGGGATTELAAAPEGASLATGFHWRLSIASVAGSGPFSPFPGVDRVIVQLTGEPMRLDHGEHGRHGLTLLRPYRFPGDWSTKCELAGEKATDFNVMTRRGAATAHVESLGLAAGVGLTRPVRGTLAVYVVRGELRVDGAPLVAESTALVTAADVSVGLEAASDAWLLVVQLGGGGADRQGRQDERTEA